MKLGKISGLVAGLLLMCGTLAAQQSAVNMTLICPTTDGNITVDENFVRIRDYKLSLSDEQTPGIILLQDNHSSATAILDTRSEDGIYLAVTEGGITMQIVAARKHMKFDDGTLLKRPASPGVSSDEERISPDMRNRFRIIREALASESTLE